MKKKQLVKIDINFLEYPNFLIACRTNIKSLTIEKPHGTYHISTTEKADRLPDRVDKIILYYLLLQKKKNIQITRYRIVKDVFEVEKGSVTSYYNRVIKALERWTWVGIKFEGVFYEGDGYTKRVFHIIDSFKLSKKDKRGEELTIRINRDFFEQLEHTDFFKTIDFTEFKKLRKPVSARLYEILIKTFKDRENWKIGIILLAEKMTLTTIKYPSDILKKLWPAVREINKKTKLKFKMEYNDEARVCEFSLLKEASKEISSSNTEELNKLLATLPESLRRQKSVKEMLSEYLAKNGFVYTQSNITYTLQNAKRNKKAFLKKALDDDYGEETRAQITAENIWLEEKKNEEEKRKKREEEENRLWWQVRKWIKKHGGIDKALYNGHPVAACSPVVGGLIVQIDENKRKNIPLEEVKEGKFSSSKKNK